MANRSLFSPFASSVSPYAVRGLRNLFTRPDSIEINPDYLTLLQSGVEPPPEMLITTPPFKGGNAAKAANAKFLSDLVQARFGSELAASKEKELIPFRSQAELEKAKELTKFERQQKKEIEEEDLTEKGIARGQVLGSLPEEQFRNIIPPGTTFQNPAQQERFYQQRVGGDIPVSKAVIETDPNVIRGRVGEEAGKRFLSMGNGFYYDTITGEYVQGGRYENVQQQVPFDTGKPVPEIDPVTGEATDKLTTVKTLKTISQPQYFPGRAGQMKATQGDFDDIPKESGAQVNPNLSTIGVDTNRPRGDLLAPTASILPQLPLNTTLQQPSLVLPQPAVQSTFGERFSKGMKSLIPKEMQELFPSKKKEEKLEKKERPKAYPLDHLIEANRLDKDQKEAFEFFVQSYTKREGRYPSLEEARAYIKTLVNKK